MKNLNGARRRMEFGDTLANIKAMYVKDGLGYRAIAKRLNISPESARKAVLRSGAIPRGPGRVPGAWKNGERVAAGNLGGAKAKRASRKKPPVKATPARPARAGKDWKSDLAGAFSIIEMALLSGSKEVQENALLRIGMLIEEVEPSGEAARTELAALAAASLEAVGSAFAEESFGVIADFLAGLPDDAFDEPRSFRAFTEIVDTCTQALNGFAERACT